MAEVELEDRLRNERAWPHWPKQPLKRMIQGVQQLGVLVPRRQSGMYLVYHAALYEPLTDHLTVASYTCIKELLDDGWTI